MTKPKAKITRAKTLGKIARNIRRRVISANDDIALSRPPSIFRDFTRVSKVQCAKADHASPSRRRDLPLRNAPCFRRVSFNSPSDAQDKNHLHARSCDGEERDTAPNDAGRRRYLPTEHESRQARLGAGDRSAPSPNRWGNFTAGGDPARYPGTGDSNRRAEDRIGVEARRYHRVHRSRREE